MKFSDLQKNSSEFYEKSVELYQLRNKAYSEYKKYDEEYSQIRRPSENSFSSRIKLDEYHYVKINVYSYHHITDDEVYKFTTDHWLYVIRNNKDINLSLEEILQLSISNIVKIKAIIVSIEAWKRDEIDWPWPLEIKNTNYEF